MHQIDERVKIVFISEAATALIEYANINLEYLNPMLQRKIYNTENPLSFDKLLSSGRLTIFKDVQEYLKFKKTGGGQNAAGLAGPDNIFNFGEYTRELIICSH